MNSDQADLARHNDREGRIRDEYKALREELKINRQFIFERPLLIVGVAFVAMLNLGNQIGFAGISAGFFVFLFFYNLWFTANRIRSNARIVGYIQEILEGPFRKHWIGWERSLVFYRRWCLESQERSSGSEARHDKADEPQDCNSSSVVISDVAETTESEIRAEFRKERQYDSRRFYSPIYWFHIAVAFMAVLVCTLARGDESLKLAGVQKEQYTSESRAAPQDATADRLGGVSTLVTYSRHWDLALTWLIFFVSLGLAWARWAPHKIRNGIEAESKIWSIVGSVYFETERRRIAEI